MACQNFLIKLALPLYFYLITCARVLLYSHHRALVSLRWRIPSLRTDVTVALAGMTVVVTSEKFLHGPRLRGETVHTKMGGVLATYIRVRCARAVYGVPVHHLPVDQTHQCFLTVIDIAALSARRDETYGMGLEETFTQHLIACGRVSNGFHENLCDTCLDKFSTEHSARLP